jgi:uncharacterized repeat protein (TIGR01451 family)
VTAGANVTYTLVAANAGPSTATSITVTDTLPAGAVFQSAAGTNWTCNQASGVVTCTRANIPSSSVRTISVVVKAPAANGTLTNTAAVAAATADPTPANNTESESTTVTGGVTRADFDAVRRARPCSRGRDLTYTLNVANAGLEAATAPSSPIRLAGAGFVSATGGGCTCSQASGP